MLALVLGFSSLSTENKLTAILCPTSAKAVKVTDKYIDILFSARKCIDSGEHISNLTFPPVIDDYSWDSLSLSLSISDESVLSDADSIDSINLSPYMSLSFDSGSSCESD